MNFRTFSASTTNIFPAANATNGSQLLSEWNLRSREMVSTDPAITYEVGPSYTHGEKDFEVSLLSDSGGLITSGSILSIAEGRAVINGHYVENVVPMTIDLAEANSKLASQARPILKGKLAIGIKTYYATDATVAGSILVEVPVDDTQEGAEPVDYVFSGVQMVILPEEEFKTPSDCPLDRSQVTADLKLATFIYLNGVVTNIVNLPSKMQFLTSERVKDLDTIVSNKYVTKTGLNSKKLYAFAGKGYNPGTGRDTWEDVTDSIMVWDFLPERTSEKPTIKQAGFSAVVDQEKGQDGIYLIIPHKQVSGMTDDDGNYEYYAPRILELPQANYSTASPGVVTNQYTRRIQDIANKVNDFRNSLSGRQIMYIDTRTVTTTLPQINQKNGWEIGDYILVRHDDYLMEGSSATESSPATLYVVLPGYVETVEFIGPEPVHGYAGHEPEVPSNITGAELGFQEWYEAAGTNPPQTLYPDTSEFFDPDYPPRGVPYNSESSEWHDYFRIRYYLKNDEGQYPGEVNPFDDYYFGVATSGSWEWSDAVMLTGSVALATENTIGGFYNAASNATDQGYVRIDDTGHLKLIDYDLLRSGTLAYQLADDIYIPEGSTVAEIQNYLYEYVNQRIAFPPGNQISDYPSIVEIHIPIPATDEDSVIEIQGIDSRFNTALCIYIEGEAGSNVTINIRDCQKLMIYPSIKGNPVINVYRSCLRYDPEVFQYIKTCERDEETYGTFTGMRDISLWYERIYDTDPSLTVNDMTVSQLDSHILVADINYWKELNAPVINDNNYLVALKSITMTGEGEIIGCEILAANNSTDNIVVGEKIIVGETALPQGSSLIYPTACLTRQLKVDGTFTSAYFSEEHWYVTDTSFTLLSGVYNELEPASPIKGQVAFHSKTSLVVAEIEQTSIEAWESDTYHVFRGGSIN